MNPNNMNLSLHVLFGAAFSFAISSALAQGPEITSWQINTDGATGQYWNGGTLTPTNNAADVQLVQYSETFVYVASEGIPRYATSPFPDGNPSQPQEQGYLFQIPREPIEGPAGGTATGLGHTAVLINGVPTFNALDAFSYNNQGVWNQNGVYFENDGFDCAKGHPAMGSYHHHQVPSTFNNSLAPTSNICDDFPSDALIAVDPDVHSPLIGWAFDGYPIYGPFGHALDDGTGGIERITSSYQLRDIVERTTLPDGTALAPNQYGPTLDELVTPPLPGAQPTMAILGAYIQDYEFIDGSGHLDAFNGRFAVTPDFPEGTYAYYATVDEHWNGAYPYFFPRYRGIVETDNFGGGGPGGPGGTNVSIDEDVITYNPLDAVTHLSGDARGWGAFPNPSLDGTLTWQGLLPRGYELMDSQGRIVDAGSLPSGTMSWSLSLPGAGLYFLKGSDGQTIRLLHL